MLFRAIIHFCCLASLLLLVSGCPESKPTPRVVPLQGVIEHIDLKQRIVRVRYFNPKHDMDEIWPIHITGETELLINDVLALPEDARVGEKATGTVRIEFRNRKENRLTALRVRIARELEPESQPVSTQPAEPAS